MLLIDVNVLIFAYRAESEHHTSYRRWLEHALESGEPCGFADLVLSAVVRLITHPRIYREPASLESALKYVTWLREQATAIPVAPGPRHWQLFTQLCRTAGVRGSLVTDAYFAALAMESGAEWITADRDYARFPGLRWRHPLG
jgi:hypothetical protein